MSGRGFIEALNKDVVTAIVRLINIISPPIIIYIGTIFIGKANVIIKNQEQFAKTIDIHTAQISDLQKSDIKLQRFDRLFGVKQEAMKDALQANPTIGKIFQIDYDFKYQEKLNESNFLNP